MGSKREVVRDEETIAAAKAIKNERRRAAVGKALAYIGKNAMPKGIRHPDSLVTNKHLYMPVKGTKNKKVRLF